MNLFDDERATAVPEGPSERGARLSLVASDLAFGDIDILFRAVQARLTLATSVGFSSHCAARGDDPTVRMRETVLDCVNELEHLHATMTCEVGRRRLLEQIVCDLNDALANVQAELAGTRAGDRRQTHLTGELAA
jgi:hypothetical protein